MKKVAVVMSLCLLTTCARAAPGDVLETLSAPGRTCTGLAYDGKSIWVADHGLDELIAISPESKKVVKRIASPGYRPAGLAFDGAALWSVDTKEAKIYRVRPADGMVTRTIPSPVKVPRALAFDGEALWLSDDDSRSIHRVDATDGTTISEVPFPGPSVDGLAFDGRYLWVADRLSDKLFMLHPSSGEVLVTLASPGPHPTGLGYDGKNLLLVDYQTDEISVIKRDDKQFKVFEDEREAWVVFTHQVRNFGPDQLAELEVFLALPRNLDSQRLQSKPVFEPAPDAYLADRWGQKVARFSFKDVAAPGSARVEMRVHLKQRTVHYVVYPEKVEPLQKIPLDIRRRYLRDETKYDLENPIIRKAVEEAVGREKSPYWIARKIYGYVHEHMHYEMVGGWDVAPKLLERGSGSCSEYSYVFIALCRAAGLPARYAGALVVRKDDASYDDVFHRWVEVYLPPYGWIPIDPSRGDKPTQAERADSFGHVYHDFLITTHGGGGSRYLGWGYNYDQRYTCRGRCKVEIEPVAEWSPENPRSAR